MRPPRRSRGIAYVEVLVALTLVVVCLVPAMNALQAGVRGSATLPAIAAREAALQAKMEQVLAQPFSALNAETFLAGGNTTTSVSATFSDASGSAERRVVILYRTDGSAPSAADTGVVRVRVAFEAGGLGLETLKSKWW